MLEGNVSRDTGGYDAGATGGGRLAVGWVDVRRDGRNPGRDGRRYQLAAATGTDTGSAGRAGGHGRRDVAEPSEGAAHDEAEAAPVSDVRRLRQGNQPAGYPVCSLLKQDKSQKEMGEGIDGGVCQGMDFVVYCNHADAW